VRLAVDRATAVEAVESAACAHEAAGWPLEAAVMRMPALQVLSRRPDASEASALLATSALTRFRAMGADGWCRRLEALLRGLGRPVPRRSSPPGAFGLTRRELEVLALLVEGLSNRQIAERLVISPSTVTRHVANIFTKLDVHTRAQAVRTAFEAGLLTATTAS
jgi:DNA-binding CsgD family transcriptional regulator